MMAVPYRHYHLNAIAIQEMQAEAIGQIKAEHSMALEKAGPAYTLLDGNQVLACAGLVEQWQGRAIAWALISKNLNGFKFARMHKMCARFLDMQDYPRIEMAVDHEHEAGHRWALALGFEWEGLMKKYSQFANRDCDLYARIR